MSTRTVLPHDCTLRAFGRGGLQIVRRRSAVAGRGARADVVAHARTGGESPGEGRRQHDHPRRLRRRARAHGPVRPASLPVARAAQGAARRSRSTSSSSRRRRRRKGYDKDPARAAGASRGPARRDAEGGARGAPRSRATSRTRTLARTTTRTRRISRTPSGGGFRSSCSRRGRRRRPRSSRPRARARRSGARSCGRCRSTRRPRRTCRSISPAISGWSRRRATRRATNPRVPGEVAHGGLRDRQAEATSSIASSRAAASSTSFV